MSSNEVFSSKIFTEPRALADPESPILLSTLEKMRNAFDKTEGSQPEMGRGPGVCTISKLTHFIESSKLSTWGREVRPYRPMNFWRSVSEFMYGGSCRVCLHAVITSTAVRGALATQPLYRPIILGSISAYEYAICLVTLVFTSTGDKMIARSLILVW